MILKNNEEKRNTLWRTVVAVSSVLIVIIAAFFIIKLFTGNPLEGNWAGEEMDVTLEVTDGGKAILMAGNDSDRISVQVECSVDTDTKTFTIQSNESEIQAAAEEQDADAYAMQELADAFAGTYDYSIEQNTLTLTEREYGEQMVFERR